MSVASNVTSGFVDLATYDELEKYMYGGADATAYFVRETRKSTWFTQVPVALTRSSGDAQFGQEWSAQISRSGDYLLNTWLQVSLPALSVTGSPGAQSDKLPQLRWCHNLMHNLVEECSITFNDLVAARFDSFHLDFMSQFAVPESKQGGYQAMIGANSSGCQPVTAGSAALCGQHTLSSNAANLEDGYSMQQHDGLDGTAPNTQDGLPATTLYLPLPFFFSRDSGVALPTAALPYNEMRINLKFRNWNQLLLVSDLGAQFANCRGVESTTITTNSWDGSANTPSTYTLNATPKLTNVHVWGNYAIVSNDERKRMACAPRDMLVEQVQSAPRQSYDPATNSSPSYNLRFSHAIKALFFAVRNVTCANEWSYYTVAQPLGGHGVADGGAALDVANHSQFPDFFNSHYLSAKHSRGSIHNNNPIDNVNLVYENTARLQNMGTGYHSLVQPHFHAPKSGAREPGYHMYSYSLDFASLDPLGSTNYGKLTNVSLSPNASSAVVAAAGTRSEGLNALHTGQKYQFVCTAINNNIIRISGGALGFPVL